MRALGILVILGLLSASPAGAVSIGASVDLSLRANNFSTLDNFNASGISGDFNARAEAPSALFASSVVTRARGFVSPAGDFGSMAPSFPGDPSADIFEASFVFSATIGFGQGSNQRSGEYVVDYVLTFTTDGPVKFVLNDLDILGFETNRMEVKFGLLGSSSFFLDETFANDRLQISNLTRLLLPGTYEFSIFAEESAAGLQFRPDLDIEMNLTMSEVTAIPLPASIWLLATCLVAFGGRRFIAQ